MGLDQIPQNVPALPQPPALQAPVTAHFQAPFLIPQEQIWAFVALPVLPPAGDEQQDLQAEEQPDDDSDLDLELPPAGDGQQDLQAEEQPHNDGESDLQLPPAGAGHQDLQTEEQPDDDSESDLQLPPTGAGQQDWRAEEQPDDGSDWDGLSILEADDLQPPSAHDYGTPEVEHPLLDYPLAWDDYYY
jgi:hypothetical protein